jgi:hypothetical protein
LMRGPRPRIFYWCARHMITLRSNPRGSGARRELVSGPTMRQNAQRHSMSGLR